MNKQLIAVVDGARARLYAVGRRPGRAGRTIGSLEELETLVDPSHRLRDHELYSDNRPGQRREFAGGPAHGVDDRRDAHNAELDRRFAVEVIDAIARLAAEHGASEVVLVAGPPMLGVLRGERDRLAGLELRELGKNLTRLPAPSLYDQLADAGLVDQV